MREDQVGQRHRAGTLRHLASHAGEHPVCADALLGDPPRRTAGIVLDPLPACSSCRGVRDVPGPLPGAFPCPGAGASAGALVAGSWRRSAEAAVHALPGGSSCRGAGNFRADPPRQLRRSLGDALQAGSYARGAGQHRGFEGGSERADVIGGIGARRGHRGAELRRAAPDVFAETVPGRPGFESARGRGAGDRREHRERFLAAPEPCPAVAGDRHRHGMVGPAVARLQDLVAPPVELVGTHVGIGDGVDDAGQGMSQGMDRDDREAFGGAGEEGGVVERRSGRRRFVEAVAVGVHALTARQAWGGLRS